jgi:DNA-binding transcriptional ArsR family regulator
MEASLANDTRSERRERLVTIFSALSDPTRVEMLELILRNGEVGCSEFDRRFPLSKSTISYHTKILNAAGLITTRRDGRFFSYRPVLALLDEQLPCLVDRLIADD